MSSSIEIRGACPYCEYRFTVDARDIQGQNFAIRCGDCREIFVVEVTVAVSHAVRKLVGVDPDKVLDRLVQPRGKKSDELPRRRMPGTYGAQG